MYETLLRSWSQDHTAWLVSAGLTIAVYVAAALAIPIALARLPIDYFSRPSRPPRMTVRILRIVVGVALTAMGVALLFLPGPGIVTILLGLSVIGGPIPQRYVRTLAARPRVLDAINEIRRKHGKPPLRAPGEGAHDSA
ncbi:hypothetical protein A7982_13371 [Minicystis rosea]|nr:hypothetical protein A7982_13371 [Minicystis rosea]